MIDIGVARPRAHGQAIISTATATTKPCARRGSGPNNAQAKNARSAATTTAGTKYAETLSARRCIGARLRWASLTSFTICASMVSLPTRSVSITKLPLVFRVPRSEEHTSELQSLAYLVCRLLLEKKKNTHWTSLLL